MRNSDKNLLEETADISEEISGEIDVLDEDFDFIPEESITIEDDILETELNESESVQDDFPEIRILDSDRGEPRAHPQKETAIGINENMRRRLPQDFDLSSIGSIDLREAEKIANEEVVFLSEDDLIEGLEEFELIPLKKMEAYESLEPERIPGDAPQIKVQVVTPKPKHAVSVDEDIIFRSPVERDEEILIIDDLPAEQISEVTSDDPVSIDEDQDDEAEKVFEAPPADEEKVFKLEEIELQGIDKTDDIILFDNERDEFRSEKKLPYSDNSTETADFDKEDGSSFELPDVSTAPAVSDKELPDEGKGPVISVNDEALNIQLAAIMDIENVDEFEKIPARFGEFELLKKIKFIDDDYFSPSRQEGETALHSDPLTERLVEMVDVIDGNLIVLDETVAPKTQISYILEDIELTSHSSAGLIERDEMYYGDSDLDFVENSVIRDDYGRYIQEIDEYYESDFEKSDSEISKILGLVDDESSLIEEKMFGEYYSTIDVDSEIEFLTTNLDFFDRGYLGEKEFDYILADPESFLSEEKRSIEEDVTSGKAIIFEEDVADLIQLLEEGYGNDHDHDHDHDHEEIKRDAPPPDVSSTSENADVEPDLLDEIEIEVIQDITDSVIILEDQAEIEKFTNEFPEKKEDLIKLFSYLDGLFEKLPEETVRKFAESEYFDLYSKVLKEMGV